MTTSREIVRPDRLDLDSLGRRDYHVALEHDSIWGEHWIPLTVWVGPEAKPNKGLVALGANHGNEYEGPCALKNLLHEIKIDDVRGRIILIPVLNPAAFWCGQRESREDDGVNLNRAFVEGAGIIPALNGITHRIAQFVREYIWPRVSVVLDLHAGGNIARFALNSSFHWPGDSEHSRLAQQTALGYGTPFVIAYRDPAPGYLPSEGDRLGKITIGSELGWGTSVYEEGVRCARRGVLHAAILHDQLQGDMNSFWSGDEDQIVVSIPSLDCSVRAPYFGHFEPLVPCGTKVDKGRPVALLHDFARIDEKPLQLRAGIDGYVIAQAWHAPVRQGQWVVLIGEEVRLLRYSTEYRL